MEKILKFKVFLLLTCLLISVSVNANHYCYGKVKDVQINRGGNVNATIIPLSGSGFVAENGFFCDLTPTNGENDPEFCKALYSTLLTAHATQSEVTLWFNNDDIDNKSCNKGDWKNLYKDYGFYHFRVR